MTARSERGSITPYVIAGLLLMVLLSLGIGVVAGGLAGVRRAQAAADLAALAAATAVQHGGDACAEAGRVADENGAVVRDCAVRGEGVRVVVTLATPRMLGRDLDVEARAHAGPR